MTDIGFLVATVEKKQSHHGQPTEYKACLITPAQSKQPTATDGHQLSINHERQSNDPN